MTEQKCNSRMNTLVVGLGNPILGDDGVGVQVADAVRAALSPHAPVDVEEACVGGLSLMERMVGYDRAILIDAFCDEDTAPGTLTRMSLHELAATSPTQHSASAHDTSLVTAIDAGRRMGLRLPTHVTIFAIVVDAAHLYAFSDELTPAVAATIPAAVRAVLAELGEPKVTRFETVEAVETGGG